MERVTTIEGDTPVLLLAPHGFDDINTDVLTEWVADEFGAFAVINRGFQKSPKFDYEKDLANCNDIRHLHKEVVKEEFLDPIFRAVAKIKRKYDDNVFVLILHGCSDSLRMMAGDPRLDMIVGSGDGRPPSYSCNKRIKNAFIHFLKSEKIGVYEGKPKGMYSGKSKNNLNQLFTQWYPTQGVNSLQLEITHELRTSKLKSTMKKLVSAIDSLMLFDDTIDYIEGETKKI
jgi:hypothetical protein